MPEDWLDEMIYTISISNPSFPEQLRTEQDSEATTKYTKSCIERKAKIEEGQLRRVSKQLRIENRILTKKQQTGSSTNYAKVC